jgi:FkbM family methyltransferase
MLGTLEQAEALMPSEVFNGRVRTCRRTTRLSQRFEHQVGVYLQPLRDLVKARMAKRLIRRGVARLGYSVTRLPVPDESPSPNYEVEEFRSCARILASYGVTLVLDVGANVGQFGAGLRQAGYSQRIVSFEPLPTAFRELAVAASADGLWEAVNCALGEATTDLEIHVSANSVSSSLLPMLPRCSAAAPQAAYIASETVPVFRADEVVPHYLRDDDVVFLKLDVQGYESRVLTGAVKVLSRVTVMQLEMSLVPLYEGESLFLDLCWVAESAGFTLFDIAPVFRDSVTGQLLQVDATFVREDGHDAMSEDLQAPPDSSQLGLTPV